MGALTCANHGRGPPWGRRLQRTGLLPVGIAHDRQLCMVTSTRSVWHMGSLMTGLSCTCRLHTLSPGPCVAGRTVPRAHSEEAPAGMAGSRAEARLIVSLPRVSAC